MKIISYSDLHLEFGTDFKPPTDSDADVMILAGDIITFRDYEPLTHFLEGWDKPVLFVAGNHEYYTNTVMGDENKRFKEWLKTTHPNATFLQDEAITIDNVHFFGGTMWTDFCNKSEKAMLQAQAQMNDYRLIRKNEHERLTPMHTVEMHEVFVEKLNQWFSEDLPGARVVITHNAPVINPNTKYINSPLSPAFNSLDMIDVIKEYQPDLWVYGHTHECDDHYLGKTRMLSNQLGYPDRVGSFECAEFDKKGKSVEIRTL